MNGTLSDERENRVGDRLVRWQDITRRSLDFVNNTVIVLASALIAVVFNAAVDTTKVEHLHKWQLYCADAAIILLGLSLAAGVAAAANRLQSVRLTARQIRIRQQFDATQSAQAKRVADVGDAAADAYSASAAAESAVRDFLRTATEAESVLRARADEAVRDASAASNAALAIAAAARNAYDVDAALETLLTAQAAQATQAVAQNAQTAAQTVQDLRRTEAADAAVTAAQAAAAAAQAVSDPDAAPAAEAARAAVAQAAVHAAKAATETARAAARSQKSDYGDMEALKKDIHNLTNWEHWTRRGYIRELAKDAEDHPQDRELIDKLRAGIRKWSNNADLHTWWLIRAQLALFFVGSVCFAVIPLWILFSTK